jgi:cathepsin H
VHSAASTCPTSTVPAIDLMLMHLIVRVTNSVSFHLVSVYSTLVFMRNLVASTLGMFAHALVDPESQLLFNQHSTESGYELGLDGPFASMPWNEFQSSILMSPQDCSATLGRSGFRGPRNAPLPTHVDWREKGVVSGVKNQGKCGSCWTFSTTGAMEAHHAINYKNWRTSEMAEQQLLDCATDFDNHGCNGGLPSHAFEYIHAAGGLFKEFFYPYRAESTGDNSKCKFDPSASSKIGGRTVRSFNVTEGDEESLMHIVAREGPVSVAFEVVEDFRLYKRGIYSSEKCKQGPADVNHAVLVVGYGTEPDVGRPYWIVKNSWGTDWGEDGYFRIARGKNMCGIATCASFPVLDKDSEQEEIEQRIDIETI